MVLQRLASRQSIIASFGTYVPDQYSTNQNPCQVLADLGPLVFNILVRIGGYFPMGVPQADTCQAQVRDTEHCPTGRAAVRPQGQPGAWAVPHDGRPVCHLTFWHRWVILDEIVAVCPARTVRYLAMVLALRLRGCDPGP